MPCKAYREVVYAAKRNFLIKLLADNGGCITLAARNSGFNRTALIALVHKHVPEFRNTPMPVPLRKLRQRRAWGGNTAWKSLDDPVARP